MLPVDVEAVSVYPHAHYLATRMEGTATLARRQAGTAAVDSALEHPLAGPVPLSRSGAAAARHGAADALRLRQLRGQSQQPLPAAAPRAVGAAVDRRDGRLVAGSGAERAGDAAILARDYDDARAGGRDRVGRARAARPAGGCHGDEPRRPRLHAERTHGRGGGAPEARDCRGAARRRGAQQSRHRAAVEGAAPRRPARAAGSGTPAPVERCRALQPRERAAGRGARRRGRARADPGRRAQPRERRRPLQPRDAPRAARRGRRGHRPPRARDCHRPAARRRLPQPGDGARPAGPPDDALVRARTARRLAPPRPNRATAGAARGAAAQR